MATALLVVADLDRPLDGARLCVERDEMRVDRRDVDRVAENCDAAIRREKADREQVGRQRRGPSPDRLAGAHVEGRDRGRRLGDVHDAVDNDRRRLKNALTLQLVDPLNFQVLHILRVDLLQPRETLRGVVAAVGEPILRMARRHAESRRRSHPAPRTARSCLTRVRAKQSHKESIDVGCYHRLHRAAPRLARYATRSFNCVSVSLSL